MGFKFRIDSHPYYSRVLEDGAIHTEYCSTAKDGEEKSRYSSVIFIIHGKLCGDLPFQSSASQKN